MAAPSGLDSSNGLLSKGFLVAAAAASSGLDSSNGLLLKGFLVTAASGLPGLDSLLPKGLLAVATAGLPGGLGDGEAADPSVSEEQGAADGGPGAAAPGPVLRGDDGDLDWELELAGLERQRCPAAACPGSW